MQHRWFIEWYNNKCNTRIDKRWRWLTIRNCRQLECRSWVRWQPLQRTSMADQVRRTRMDTIFPRRIMSTTRMDRRTMVDVCAWSCRSVKRLAWRLALIECRMGHYSICLKTFFSQNRTSIETRTNDASISLVRMESMMTASRVIVTRSQPRSSIDPMVFLDTNNKYNTHINKRGPWLKLTNETTHDVDER